MPTQHFIDDLVPAGASASPRRMAAGHRTPAEVRQALARNIVVARCIVAWQGSRSTIRPVLKAIIELAAIALLGSTLVTVTSAFVAVNALLTVGFVGIVAGRCAAATGNRRPASGRRRPANDNPFGCVLPPPLLRC